MNDGIAMMLIDELIKINENLKDINKSIGSLEKPDVDQVLIKATREGYNQRKSE